ncbi:ThiF family adenylyltransferase [Paludisphaera sp.]|uniref:HesA/MoeB/ThiF family protein n=1 Tax=Paludisphaera sp. TaxID=2017432 RepID=UPI00301C87FB
MAEVPRAPLNLRAARRSLQGIAGCEVLDDWSYSKQLHRWVLRCRLTISASNHLVPAATDWFVAASPSYPWGALTFFPSKEGGLAATFPHQNFNGPGSKERPWRDGDICLHPGLRVLGRHGFNTEPFESNNRLRWRVSRALDWLRAADAGTLVQPGDPFELPQFPGAADSRTLLTFDEGGESFRAWQATEQQIGTAELTPVRRKGDVYAVTEFCSLSGVRLWRPSWPLNSPFKCRPEDTAIWLRLADVPVLEPWRAPATWGELRAACEQQGIDLDQLLKPLLATLRDGRPHRLLIGFPIPNAIGGTVSQLHWQAIELPTVSHGSQTRRGFRPQRQGQWLRDRRQLLRDEQEIQWVETENWSRDRLISRGRLSGTLATSHALLIGAGALGSTVAELLVRAGVTRLTVLDHDHLEAGNLCRHTLLMSELRESKANALAVRLSGVNPHVEVDSLDGRFPPALTSVRESLRACDLVIDCSADDGVLHELARYPWGSTRRFASLSLGFGAKRLFCYTTTAGAFPSGQYRKAIQPWLEREQDESRDSEPIRPGAGCWHPIFPARADDVWLLGAAAVKYLDHVFPALGLGSRLTVFEQQYDDGFSGIRRVIEEGAHE